MKINLHIDRLVLDGLDLSHSDQLVLETAVASELTRLLSNNPSIHQYTNTPITNNQSIQANPIQYNETTPTRHLANQIAHSVYGGLQS